MWGIAQSHDAEWTDEGSAVQLSGCSSLWPSLWQCNRRAVARGHGFREAFLGDNPSMQNCRVGGKHI